MFLFLYMLCIFSPARARADRDHGDERAMSGTLFFGCRCYVKSIDRSITCMASASSDREIRPSLQWYPSSNGYQAYVRHIEGKIIAMRGGAV